MRKAKMSFQSGQVKQVIRTYAVEIQTSDKRELDADAVTMKLRKAMGANCTMSICNRGEKLLTHHRRSSRFQLLRFPFAHNIFLDLCIAKQQIDAREGLTLTNAQLSTAVQISSIVLEHALSTPTCNSPSMSSTTINLHTNPTFYCPTKPPLAQASAAPPGCFPLSTVSTASSASTTTLSSSSLRLNTPLCFLANTHIILELYICANINTTWHTGVTT